MLQIPGSIGVLNRPTTSSNNIYKRMMYGGHSGELLLNLARNHLRCEYIVLGVDCVNIFNGCGEETWQYHVSCFISESKIEKRTVDLNNNVIK
ncbi:hypothetical protein M8C21_029617, partial [Ambrosia artemisiifolia]